MLHQRGRSEELCIQGDAGWAVHIAHRCVCLSQIGLHHLDARLSCCKALSHLLVAGSCVARSCILKQGYTQLGISSLCVTLCWGLGSLSRCNMQHTHPDISVPWGACQGAQPLTTMRACSAATHTSASRLQQRHRMHSPGLAACWTTPPPVGQWPCPLTPAQSPNLTGLLGCVPASVMVAAHKVSVTELH